MHPCNLHSSQAMLREGLWEFKSVKALETDLYGPSVSQQCAKGVQFTAWVEW